MMTDQQRSKSSATPAANGWRDGLLFSCDALPRWLMAAGSGLIRTHAQESFPLPAINPPGAKASSRAASTTTPTASAGAQPEAPPARRCAKPEVAKQCADMLKMATELKTEVDKSNKDTLSVRRGPQGRARLSNWRTR